MSTVMPQSELLRKAVNWIAENMADTGKPLSKVLEDAGMRFNLSPKDHDFLKEFFANPENVK